MAINGVVLQFRADADQARRDVNKLTRSIEGVGKESQTSSRKMSKLAKVGVAAVAAGAVIGAAALLDFAKAATQDWQESEKLARTLKKIPGITDDMVQANAKWIDSMEIATGFADSEFRDAIARLAVATGDLGEAQDLAGLAADVAAGRNKGLLDIVPLLEKAVAGNTSALKRQMPWLDANKDGALTAKEAFDGLAGAYGGAAKAAEDNDVLGRLGTIWSQLKESLGQFAIKPLQALADWLKDPKNLEGLDAWLGKVATFSDDVGRKLVDWIKNDAVPALDDLREWFASPEGKAQIENITTAISGMVDTVVALGKAIEITLGWLQRLAFHDTTVRDAMGSAARSGAFDSPTLNQGPINMVVPRRRTSPSSGGEGPMGNRATVNVVVNNGRQEPSVDSAALAIRIAKRAGA